MSFEVRINGKTVWRTDRQVTNVSLQGAKGEAGVMGISDEGVVDVVISEVALAGPMRLDHLEAAEKHFELDAIPEDAEYAVMTGSNYVPQEDANRVTQGHPSYLTDGRDNPKPGAPIKVK